MKEKLEIFMKSHGEMWAWLGCRRGYDELDVEGGGVGAGG